MHVSRRIPVGLSALICLFALLHPGPLRAQSEALTRSYQRGSSLVEAGMYKAATPYLVKALELSETEFGRESSRTAFILKNLATVYTRQGMFGAAEPLYTRALGIFEEAFGPDHGIVAEVVNELSIAYIEQRRYIEAEPLLARVLDSLERTFGSNDSKVAVAAYNYGYTSEYLGDSNKARKLYARALEIWQSQPVPDEDRIRAVTRRLEGLKRVHASKGPSLAPYLPRVLPGGEARDPAPPLVSAPRPETGHRETPARAADKPRSPSAPPEVPAVIPEPQPLTAGPTRQAAANAPEAAAKADASAPAEKSGEWRVQVASLRAREAAEQESARLGAALSSVLKRSGGLKVAEAALPNGTFYRIFAGPFADRGEAAALCRDLKAEKQDCIVIRQN